MTWLRVLVLICAVLLMAPAFAVGPDEILPNPALESRARDISAGLRCLVCQNQSIDDSDADLARDLRILVRERLLAGDSDEAVRQFLVDRYGEYVLLAPRLGAHTMLLWAAGPLLLLVGVGGLWLAARRHKRQQQGEMTDDEAEALDSLRQPSSER
jgi:cytochrome c-type biogenesis protein CcmH